MTRFAPTKALEGSSLNRSHPTRSLCVYPSFCKAPVKWGFFSSQNSYSLGRESHPPLKGRILPNSIITYFCKNFNSQFAQTFAPDISRFSSFCHLYFWVRCDIIILVRERNKKPRQKILKRILKNLLTNSRKCAIIRVYQKGTRERKREVKHHVGN